MIRHRRPAAALAALGLAATFSLATTHAPEGCYVALEGDPATEDDDVIACEEQHWFHRATTHASNLGHVADPHGLPTFDTNPPAGSVTEGNGGGYGSWATLLVDGDDGLLDAPFTGTFSGVIDRLDIDLHFLASAYGAGAEAGLQIPESLDIAVALDGTEVFSATDVNVTTVVEEASEAGSRRADIAITGLAELLDGYGLDNGPDTEHTVQLTIGPGPYADNAYILAFDTTEVPGGIGFNRVDIPAGTVVLDAS